MSVWFWSPVGRGEFGLSFPAQGRIIVRSVLPGGSPPLEDYIQLRHV